MPECLNQHKIGFLEEGMKFPIHLAEIQKNHRHWKENLEIVEICRLMGVPPHKVFDLERATFSI